MQLCRVFERRLVGKMPFGNQFENIEEHYLSFVGLMTVNWQVTGKVSKSRLERKFNWVVYKFVWSIPSTYSLQAIRSVCKWSENKFSKWNVVEGIIMSGAPFFENPQCKSLLALLA